MAAGATLPAPVGWGVLASTAYVAQKAVLPALAASPRARLAAVASERGGGDTFGAGRVHRTYGALLADPEVEVVYVPLPNALHREWVERAAGAGKHVLCEKPLGVSAAEAEAMGAACRASGVALVEAYVTPFHARTAALAALVRSGRLGRLRFARVAFTGVLSRPGDHRWRPEMGGGALLDVGIYCVAPLLAAAGRPPVRLEATAVLAPSGVETSLTGWLDFGEGFSAAMECSFDAPERQLLELVGTEAAVAVDRAHTPGPGDRTLTLRHRDGRTEELEGAGNDPYRAMVEHVHDVVRGGARPLRTVEDSVACLAVLDRLRAAAGLPAAPPPAALRT